MTKPLPEDPVMAGDQPAAETAPADTVWGKLLRGTNEPAQEMDTTHLLKVAYCPKIEVREGTQVYQVGASGPTADPAAVRFQASITRFARECRQDGDTIRIRVGVAGRVLTGREGGSANLSLPVRVVAVGAEDKVFYSRLSRVPATVTTSEPSVGWSFVDEDVVIPVEPGIVLYVGFDPKGDAPASGRKRPRS
ncbi:hypothetical protein ACRC7T_12810 [Segnochrobactraceae bacterium EtOH-i3]